MKEGAGTGCRSCWGDFVSVVVNGAPLSAAEVEKAVRCWVDSTVSLVSGSPIFLRTPVQPEEVVFLELESTMGRGSSGAGV